MPLLTFIIPVRHQDNARDWPTLKANLAQTMASVAAQTHADWHGIVVANHRADLPPLPAGFEAERVDFSPNILHDRGSSSRDDFLDAFRIDKGRRVLAGMLAARESRYFMIVDDDDFVSNRLANYVSQNNGPVGWKIERGYAWTDGGRILYRLDDFNHVCGTSLIIRSDIYDLPQNAQDADRDFVMQMLGSHHGVDKLLASKGTPLTPLPFRGAIYRVGHAGSHSRTPGIMRRFVFAPGWPGRPLTLARNVSRLRPVSIGIQQEFSGPPDERRI